MTRWFEMLSETLARERISSDAARARYVPHQAYAATPVDLMHAIDEALRAVGASDRPLLVFTDGVRKQADEDGRTIDALLSGLLQQKGIAHQWIDACALCGKSTDEFHASVENLGPLKSTLANFQDAVPCVVGSGTLTDLIKHALHENGSNAPFLVVPTALTVTAFTSAFAVLDEAGAKRTRPSRPISACLWYEPVLQLAPHSMSRAGYGDLLARFVAYADWYLGFELGIMPRYDELAFRLMDVFAPSLKEAAAGFSAGVLESSAVASTAAALSMAGIAMSVSGETTPLSGYEHTISHALDFLRITSGRALVLHGEQVGLASLASATTLDWLLERETFDARRLRSMTAENATRLIGQMVANAPFFGTDEAHFDDAERATRHARLDAQKRLGAALFAEDYLKKNDKWNAAREHFPAFARRWPEIKDKLRALTLNGREMESLLQASGLPLVPEALNPVTSAMEYRWAVRFAPFVRARMCLGDFVFWLGEDPAVVAAV